MRIHARDRSQILKFVLQSKNKYYKLSLFGIK